MMVVAEPTFDRVRVVFAREFDVSWLRVSWRGQSNKYMNTHFVSNIAFLSQADGGSVELRNEWGFLAQYKIQIMAHNVNTNKCKDDSHLLKLVFDLYSFMCWIICGWRNTITRRQRIFYSPTIFVGFLIFVFFIRTNLSHSIDNELSWVRCRVGDDDDHGCHLKKMKVFLWCESRLCNMRVFLPRSPLATGGVQPYHIHDIEMA